MAGKIVAMTVAGVLLAGCGATEPVTTPPSTATSTGPSPALVAWVDSVCQVWDGAVWNPQPPVHPSEATDAHRPAIIAYLNAGRDHFAQVATLANGIGQSPVAGGDEVAANMRSKITEIANKFAEYADDATWFPDIQVPYRLAAMDLANWSIGSPSLADLANRHPAVAEAKTC